MVVEQALLRAQETGMPPDSLYPLYQLSGQIANRVGDWDSARRSLEEAITLAELGGFTQAKFIAQLELARQDLWTERPEEALARLQPLRAFMDEWGVGPASHRAEAYLRLGDLERAEREVDRALTRHAGEALPGNVLAFRVKGMVYARRGRWEDAERAFEEALAREREEPNAEFRGYALYDYGLMYRDKGESDRARAQLEAALAIFERIGAQPFVERTKKHLNSLP